MTKGKKVLVFIVIIAIIGLATFGGGYLYLTRGERPDKVVVIEEGFHEVGEIFVNLKDDKSKRYVKLNLSVSYDKSNEELTTEITEKHVVIRDAAVYYLKSCVAEDFTAENEAKIKADLVERINSKLTKGLIRDVYISEIIVQ